MADSKSGLTAFSENFVEAIESGVSGTKEPEKVTVDELFKFVRAKALSKGQPEPALLENNTVGDMPFVKNVAEPTSENQFDLVRKELGLELERLKRRALKWGVGLCLLSAFAGWLLPSPFATQPNPDVPDTVKSDIAALMAREEFESGEYYNKGEAEEIFAMQSQLNDRKPDQYVLTTRFDTFERDTTAVSYTHLTLPTTPYV